jgi:hypothetical protein
VTVPTTPSTGSCVSQAEMKLIAKDLPQFAEQAKGDYCFDGSQVSNLISSVMFMRKTGFAQTMPNSKDELFTGRFASSWYDYFVGRIDNLEIVNSCPKGVVAYVYAFGGRTMFACPMALTDQFSSLDRASVFMHEARHIDGFPHTTCSKGPRKGLQGACDVRISDGGSYAVTVETYAQLGKYATELHPALRAYARTAAVIYADEAFENTVRINRAENLLMLTSALDFHSMNVESGATQKLGKASAAGRIVRRSQHMMIIPTDKNLKAQYIFARGEGELSQSPSDAATEYNGQTPAERAKLIDIHVGAQWNARVYVDKIVFACDPTAPTLSNVSIPNGQTPANLLYPTGYDRAAQTALLAMSSGEVYELSCANRKASMTASTSKFDQKYKRIYKVGSKVFALSNEGKLFKLEGAQSTPVATGVDSSIIEIVPQQTFEFYETN